MQKDTILENVDVTVDSKINVTLLCLCGRKETYRFWNIYAVVPGKEMSKIFTWRLLITITNVIITTNLEKTNKEKIKYLLT